MQITDMRPHGPQPQSHGLPWWVWPAAIVLVVIQLWVLNNSNIHSVQRQNTMAAQVAKPKLSQVKVDCNGGDDYFRRLKANFTDREAMFLTERSVLAGCPKVVDIVRLKKPRKSADYAALKAGLQQMADDAEHTEDAMQGTPPVVAKSEDDDLLPAGVTFDQRWEMSGLRSVVRRKPLGKIMPA
ncbi:MAG TPA: hypothetical protein VHP58_04290 [Alphaproteobacteria bacterium]|nr:hypothetical protein [Alphaproteobacteria bacterium]